MSKQITLQHLRAVIEKTGLEYMSQYPKYNKPSFSISEYDEVIKVRSSHSKKNPRKDLIIALDLVGVKYKKHTIKSPYIKREKVELDITKTYGEQHFRDSYDYHYNRYPEIEIDISSIKKQNTKTKYYTFDELDYWQRKRSLRQSFVWQVKKLSKQISDKGLKVKIIKGEKHD